MKLLEIAAELEQPRTVATTRVKTCTCDVCGSQLVGGDWAGVPCGVGLGGTGCTGHYRLDPEPATDLPTIVLRCDECGTVESRRPHFEGRHCYRRLHPLWGTQCMGTLRRLDPEPATDRAGNALGVSLAELAAEQAIRDFMADDPDHDDDDTSEWPDIASTYRGRRA